MHLGPPNNDAAGRAGWFPRPRRDEIAPVLLAAAVFFGVLFAYGLLRPTREVMGISGGYGAIPWLMTAVLVAMALVNPVYSGLASAARRRVFVPVAYATLALCLVVFAGLLAWLPESARLGLGFAFYIWLSVANLLAVSIFRSVAADVFRPDQAKRLFGAIGVGGTLGILAGAWVADALAEAPPAVIMLCSAAVFGPVIVGADRLLARYGRSSPAGGHGRARDDRDPGPDPLAGLALLVRSRYLMLIALVLLVYGLTTTFLYMEQMRVIAAAVSDANDQRRIFARMEVWSQSITLGTQLVATALAVRWLRVAGALVVIPALTLAGFGLILAAPPAGQVDAVILVAVLRRGLHHGLDRPAMEMLYTPLGPDEKYKSKSFIDTFVYRAGDALGTWGHKGLVAVGAAPAAVGIGLCALGVVAGAAAGLRFARMAAGRRT